MWRIERRVERLNDLGFDVDELDIVTDLDGDTIRIQPKVVDLGHHAREIQALTGMSVEENQARRLLNDLAAFTAHFDLGREDRHLVASKWMHDIFEPIMAMIPPDATGKLEPAEIFHEILEHRWYLSEQAGHQVDIHETARDYIDRFLTAKPDEAITGAGVIGSQSPDQPGPVGAQPHPLEADRSPVGVRHQADVGVAPRLAAERDGVRRPAGGAVGPGPARSRRPRP